jgi:hypothetical protein
MSYKFDKESNTYIISNLFIDDTVDDLENILNKHNVFIEYKEQ